jgi:hypothetical protein
MLRLNIDKPVYHFLSCNGDVLFQVMSNNDPNSVFLYSIDNNNDISLIKDFVSLNYAVTTRSCRSICITDMNDPSSIAEYSSTFEHLVTACVFQFKVNITSSIYPLLKIIMEQSRMYFLDLSNNADARFSGKKLTKLVEELDDICKSISNLDSNKANDSNFLDNLIDNSITDTISNEDHD